ncbi:MAG: RDD family protein [Candidatus Eisenbacteria bacterium]
MGIDRAYAGVWPRFSALVADIVLLSCVFFPVTRIVKGTWVMSASDHDWAVGQFVTDPLCLAFLAVMFLYFVLLEGLVGFTLGKRLMRLRVVTVSGGRPGLVRALVRNVLRIVDGLPTLGLVGAIFIWTTPDRARVGDLVAGTRVVSAGGGSQAGWSVGGRLSKGNGSRSTGLLVAALLCFGVAAVSFSGVILPTGAQTVRVRTQR